MLANNIVWPGNPDEYVLKVVTDNRQLAGAIKQMTLKRQINDKPIAVSFSSYVSVPEGVHILYLTEKFKGTLQEVISQIGNQPVLIITEESSDERYLMLNLVESPDGWSFQYNRANITNQGLRLGPDFGELGGEELDVGTLYQQAKASVDDLEKKSNFVREQMDTLNMLTAVAVKLGSALMTRADETQAQVDFQNKVLKDLRRVLQDREKQLEQITADIAARRKQTRLGEVQLEAQKEEIQQQDLVIAKKTNELRDLERTSAYQVEILIFLIVFALLFLLALYLAYKAYKVRRRDAKKLNEQKQELDELLERVKAKQKQLIQAEKLAAVGEISDSIAHDVNNASNYILSGYYIISTRFDGFKELMQKVESLDTKESALKTKIKVREIANKKAEIEYDSYESIAISMMENMQVGVKRIEKVLNDLEPYLKYGELGKFGLTVLGRLDENDASARSSTRSKGVPNHNPA